MQSPESNARLSTDKNLVVVTGFSRPVPDAAKDIQHVRKFIEALTEKIQFASQRIILGCPQEHAQEHPDSRIAFIRHAKGEAKNKIIIGFSYGGVLALGEQCEGVKRGEELSDLVLVDAPLNPNVEVTPPKDGRFDAFKYQYESRRSVALRYGAVLSELSESELNKIVTIGTVQDDIVPPEAKYLSGVDHHELPSEITGHGLSPAKIQAIVKFLVARV